MVPEKIEALKASPDALAAELEAMLGLPEAERPSKLTPQRTWRELGVQHQRRK